jgi:hypothetical protein
MLSCFRARASTMFVTLRWLRRSGGYVSSPSPCSGRARHAGVAACSSSSHFDRRSHRPLDSPGWNALDASRTCARRGARRGPRVREHGCPRDQEHGDSFLASGFLIVARVDPIHRRRVRRGRSARTLVRSVWTVLSSTRVDVAATYAGSPSRARGACVGAPHLRATSRACFFNGGA